MYNSRKKPQDEMVEEVTSIWSCTNDECKGWMRDNFSFASEPTCPQCKSPMVKSEKKLTVLVNTSPNQSKD
ncbi:cold-shock protein [Paenibacillus sp. 481]|uniref:cold-shock protein n=1 Tax=Paenibacillus sp. 481 TaxID=2835869 RepID=UPI001E2CCEB9|nr:cold-shock protein [Paenibacillus sp. 481]UHA75111.1 cold-shock protein [Paenibacillus sp. 481]